MNIAYSIKQSIILFIDIVYYIFGNTIGRLAYPNYIFKSKHFKRPRSIGWKWTTFFFFSQRICGYNRYVPWPCSPQIIVSGHRNISFNIDDLNNFTTIGNYYQAAARIIIGKNTFIAPNVGIITGNHDICDPTKRVDPKEVIIGEKCWIGMNAMILPGVVLGNHTIVGAGAVVTKSFPEGYCVIAGNPSKIIKYIERIDPI